MKVVIVDDNEINLKVIEGIASHIDSVEAFSFTEPAEALSACMDELPDLLIVDYMMPDMDGLEFISLFRQIDGGADVPIIMVTADIEKEIRYEALKNGATDFLNKPIDKLELLTRMKNLLALRSSQKALSDRAAWLAKEVAKATKDILLREKEAIFRLSKAAEYRDPETGSHILRMANFSIIIAKQIGLKQKDIEILYEAAPMHDIGKVGISDTILLKPAKLNDEEFAVMKTHSTIGYEILKDSPSPLLQTAAEIALNHHEKYDGSGYPKGLAGEDIPIFARIVAVADVFDALTSVRPYKKAWSLGDAKKLLVEQNGKHFDPICVEALIACWEDVCAIKEELKDEEL